MSVRPDPAAIHLSLL